MLVEMMIFVTPSGGRLKTACCSSLERVEWSGYTSHLMRRNQNQEKRMNLCFLHFRLDTWFLQYSEMYSPYTLISTCELRNSFVASIKT